VLELFFEIFFQTKLAISGLVRVENHVHTHSKALERGDSR
jgi:hypothetical protein